MTPEAIVFTGEVTEVSSENTEGPFTILPDHARFMTVLHEAPILVTLSDKTQKNFMFEHVVLYFQDNVAKFYTHTEATSALVTLKAEEKVR